MRKCYNYGVIKFYVKLIALNGEKVHLMFMNCKKAKCIKWNSPKFICTITESSPKFSFSFN